MAQPMYTWEQLDACGALHGLFVSREQALEWINLPPDAREVPFAERNWFPDGTRGGEVYDVEWRGQRGARLRLVFPS